jgi:hypothetical protein
VTGLRSSISSIHPGTVGPWPDVAQSAKEPPAQRHEPARRFPELRSSTRLVLLHITEPRDADTRSPAIARATPRPSPRSRAARTGRAASAEA